MGSLTLKHLVCPRNAGDSFACGRPAEHRFMLESWEVDAVYGQCSASQFIRRATDVILSTDRVEGFLYIPDTLEFIAQAMYYKAEDMHYGVIAMPISILILPEYRGNIQVNRELVKLKTKVVSKLGAWKYLEVRNISQTEQHTKLKYVEKRNG